MPTPRRHNGGLIRDLEVLEVLASAEAFTQSGLGVQRIAELANRDKGQVSRVLATLAQSGFVDRDPKSRRYSLGHRFYALSLRTREAHLAMLAEPHLLELVRLTQETAHLNVMRGGRILTIKTEVSQSGTRRSGWDGMYSPVTLSASGRALLANMADQEIEAWWAEHEDISPAAEINSDLPRPIEPITKGVVDIVRTPITFTQYMEMVEVIREVGYAISDGEFQDDVLDVASVIRDAANQPVAAFSVGVPKERIGDQFQSVGQIVLLAALQFSSELGAPIVGPA
jgi:DNA-binding IclR family transcriptional regulator